MGQEAESRSTRAVALDRVTRGDIMFDPDDTEAELRAEKLDELMHENQD